MDSCSSLRLVQQCCPQLPRQRVAQMPARCTEVWQRHPHRDLYLQQQKHKAPPHPAMGMCNLCRYCRLLSSLACLATC